MRQTPTIRTRLNLLSRFLMVAGLLSACLPTPPHGHAPQSARIQFSTIPSDSVLLFALTPGIPALKPIYAARDRGEYASALAKLADYFKETATARYYYSWQDFPARYKQYALDYPGSLKAHQKQSARMKATYPAKTRWILPFKNLKGEEVSAYELRHLARQSNFMDMVLMYFATPPEEENLNYWTTQMADLNQAFTAGDYDQGGNGIYEVFRGGKRTHQWLMGHHSYLSSQAYTSKDQIESMRTFLHTAAQLAENGKTIRPGNHHTRGMVALFEIAATYREFAQADEWLALAISGISWHLENEVNTDGFQIERSVHYHKGDIENYFRVWQLAKRGNIELPEIFTVQFRKMFDALLILAQPDGRLPVLQDDTDGLHTETNDLGDVMALGTILWQDPRYAYFADKKVSTLFYWLLNQSDLQALNSADIQAPELGSSDLASTGYYVMRNGWESHAEYLVVSAGLSRSKPDHQHGDMLGVVAYANGNEILPNYQVKYNEPDYAYWKNSWTKNVCVVDSILQGRDWKGNSGGSGFGLWQELPQPKVLENWNRADIDYFAGTHDGYEEYGLEYQREIIFHKAGFWIIRDQFTNPSAMVHNYQQVWQGLYKTSDNTLIHSEFTNGSKVIIQALDHDNDQTWLHQRYAGKGCAVRQLKTDAQVAILSTLILPVDERFVGEEWNWELVRSPKSQKPLTKDLSIGNPSWLLQSPSASIFVSDQIVFGSHKLWLDREVVLYLKMSKTGLDIQLLSVEAVQVTREDLVTGQTWNQLFNSGDIYGLVR